VRITQELSNREIAAELSISPATVRTHSTIFASPYIGYSLFLNILWGLYQDFAKISPVSVFGLFCYSLPGGAA
jgi:hypothetical protein